MACESTCTHLGLAVDFRELLGRVKALLAMCAGKALPTLFRRSFGLLGWLFVGVTIDAHDGTFAEPSLKET